MSVKSELNELHVFELQGTPVETSDGKRVGLSKVAAREGIAMVTLSRYMSQL